MEHARAEMGTLATVARHTDVAAAANANAAATAAATADSATAAAAKAWVGAMQMHLAGMHNVTALAEHNVTLY